MADPLTVFAIGDIDELGLRGVVLRGTDPEAIREVGRHLHEPVVVVPVEQLKQVVEALTLIDALDPEEHVYGCSADALRGLVIQMGQHARAAKAKLCQLAGILRQIADHIEISGETAQRLALAKAEENNG